MRAAKRLGVFPPKVALMDVVWAAVLGILQGFTEFLPVSSSGHLALAQMAIPGFHQPGVVFDAMVHLGTASAVVWFERRQIARWAMNAEGRTLLALLVLATIATTALAFPLRGLATRAFDRAEWVGVGLVMTGCVVAGTRFLSPRDGRAGTMTWKQAVVVGLVQGAAVFPGISRSGITIAAGMATGLERSWAARFSFLLSVSVILGATCVEVIDQRHQLAAATPSFWLFCLVGTVAAAVAGLFALRLVLKTLSSRSFHRFAWYCVPLGLVVLVWSLGAG
jgi:undecaprenyl-diphosphatase